MGENSKHTLETSSPDSPERPSKVTKTEDFREEHEEQQLLNVVEQPMNPNPGVQRYLVAIEYIGSRFSGSQKQPKCRTVVGVLEVVFEFCLLTGKMKGKERKEIVQLCCVLLLKKSVLFGLVTIGFGKKSKTIPMDQQKSLNFSYL